MLRPMKKVIFSIIMCAMVLGSSIQASGGNKDITSTTSIDEVLLDSMSTEDLIEKILEYPMSVDIFAYNSINEGVDRVSKDFNGLYELTQRQDATNKLIKKMNSYQMDIKSDEDLYDIMLLEALLGSDNFSATLSDREMQSIISKESKINTTVFQNTLAETYDITTYDSYTYVTTPKGSKVLVTQVSSDFSAAEKIVYKLKL